MTPSPELARRITGFVDSYTGGKSRTPVLLAGDASGRRYFRVFTGATPATTVVMELPGPTSPNAGPPTTRGFFAPSTLTAQIRPTFVTTQEFLAKQAYPVPAIFRLDLENGFIGLEDLGDTTLEMAVSAQSPEGRLALYRQAVQLIAQLQRTGAQAVRTQPDFLAFHRRFDEPLLSWELDHFREWFLEREKGLKLAPSEGAILDQSFALITRQLANHPPVLVHRDFQSRNLLVQGAASIRVIDFQDMLLGPSCYDLVALLKDSYVVLPEHEVGELVSHFIQIAEIENQDNFRKLFHMQTVQRKLKDVGRFIYLDLVRRQPGYRRWIPSSLSYAARAMANVDELRPLYNVLCRYVPELAADGV